MRVFRPANIKTIRKDRGMNQGDLERELIIRAPNYKTRAGKSLKPRTNHIRSIMLGKRDTSSVYLALFADVLGCKIDDFFEIRREKE